MRNTRCRLLNGCGRCSIAPPLALLLCTWALFFTWLLYADEAFDSDDVVWSRGAADRPGLSGRFWRAGNFESKDRGKSASIAEASTPTGRAVAFNHSAAAGSMIGEIGPTVETAATYRRLPTDLRTAAVALSSTRGVQDGSEDDAAAAAAAKRTFDDLATIKPDGRCSARGNASFAAEAATFWRGGGNNLTLVILLRNTDDSLPVQTVLSAIAFTPSHLLKEVVFAHSSQVSQGFLTALFRSLAGYGRSHRMRAVSGATYYTAVMSAALSAGSLYVAVAHDNVLFTRGWFEPLLEAVAAHPDSVALPHVDAALPNLLYTHPYSDQVYDEEESVRWVFGWSLAYKLRPSAYLGGGGRAGKWLDTAATIGDALLAPRSLFAAVSRSAGVGSFMEFGFLAWMCGGGMRLVGCSRVLKANKYFVYPPLLNVGTRSSLARLYLGDRLRLHAASVAAGESLASAAANGDGASDESRAFLDGLRSKGCPRSFDWYAREVAALPFLDLPLADVAGVDRVGQLMNMQSSSCYEFTVEGEAIELDGCSQQSTVLYAESDGTLHSQSGCLGRGHGSKLTLKPCNVTRGTAYKIQQSLLITDGTTCLVRRVSGRKSKRIVAAPSDCPKQNDELPANMQWSLV